MSLLDFGRTPAWYVMFYRKGNTGYWEYSAPRWLQFGPAVEWANSYPVGSRIYQWNGRYWADPMGGPRAGA